MRFRVTSVQLSLPGVFAILAALAFSQPARAAWIWVEGEKPTRSTMHRHPYWYDQVKRDQLSGGDLISNFHDQPGEASYRFTAASAGEYELWVRANPVQAKLSYRLNDGPWTPIDVDKGLDSTNIAADGKPDLRFLAWARAGRVSLKKGSNGIRFRMDSPNHNHGYLDCFVLANEPFTPQGHAEARPARRGVAAGGRVEQRLVRLRPEARPILRVERHRFAVIERKDGWRRRLHRSQGVAVRPLSVGRAGPVLGGQRAVEPGTRRPPHGGADAGQARREPGPRPPRLLR